MKVREAKVDLDWFYNEKGKESFHCPICKALWGIEDVPIESYCKHLRFILYINPSISEFIMFSGSWDSVEGGHLLCPPKMDLAINNALTAMKHPAIDTVVYTKYNDRHGYVSIMYWGYKED